MIRDQWSWWSEINGHDDHWQCLLRSERTVKKPLVGWKTSREIPNALPAKVNIEQCLCKISSKWLQDYHQLKELTYFYVLPSNKTLINVLVSTLSWIYIQEPYCPTLECSLKKIAATDRRMMIESFPVASGGVFSLNNIESIYRKIYKLFVR